MDVSCASQEDVSPEMEVRPQLLHAVTEEVGGGAGETALGVAIGEGVEGVPLAGPPASAASSLMKENMKWFWAHNAHRQHSPMAAEYHIDARTVML
jgi:hypothetical protein